MARKGSGLTPKQQAFARCVGVRNMGLSEAYRECYNTLNMKAKTVSDKASLLRKHGGIGAEIGRYNEEADRAMIASVVSDHDLVLNSLRKHMIKPDSSDSNQIRATEVLGRTIPGLYKGEEPTVVQRTPEEITAELDELMAKYAIKADKPDKAVH